MERICTCCSALVRLQRELDQTLPAEPPRSSPAPRQQALYEELLSLHQEFEQVACDLRERTISVVTEPVELDGTYLGRFEIRLQLLSGRARPEYRVIALEPHPAASSSDTTHPHVRDERLCEGEGKLPIQLALEQGRLCDFFQIVSQVLQTYNAGSAYVALEDWLGLPCTDCGDAVDEDQHCSCEACGGTLCESCTRSCQSCSYEHCSDCIGACAGCSDDYCRPCLKACTDCDNRYCKSCLADCQCQSCREEADSDDSAEAPSASSPASLQPVVTS